MTYLSHTFRNTVMRLADAPKRTLSRVTARLNLGPRIPEPGLTVPPPAHVTLRLEGVFEAMSELAFQPSVAAALELACDAIEAELPVEALAAGLYDIDNDDMRFVCARGVGCDLVRGTALPRRNCLVEHAAEEPVITGGGVEGSTWIGNSSDASSVLLCPILHDGNLLGLLALAEPQCAARFGQHDIELVRYVADRLAGFIHAHRQRPRARGARVSEQAF